MKVTINGRPFEVEGRKTILRIARDNEIFIPSLCDHPDLVPFGGCRLCLIEVKGRRGYVPACSTFAEEGMEVMTETPELRAKRRQVLELILSEHPHACLICSEKSNCDDYKSTIRKVGEVTGCVLCPKNGHCQLQEVVEALKIDRVLFPALYRNLEIRREDPFFDRNYNLCILCGRCVRICHELRGASAISFVFRGSQAVIGTAFDRPLLESGCQFCGACVDVCPTGALTERAMRGELLPQEERRTLCPLCSLGCELILSLRDGRVMSSAAGDRSSPNQGQVCVKGRFLIRDTVYSPKRILFPMIRRDGGFEEVSWEEALDFVARKLEGFRGQKIAVIGSSQVALEDLYVLEKFSHQVLASEDFACLERGSPLAVFWKEFEGKALKPELNFEMGSLARAQAILIAGTDLAVSHPILWLEVYRALRHGGKLVLLGESETALDRHASFRLTSERGKEFVLAEFLGQRLLELRAENPVSPLLEHEGGRQSLLEKSRALETVAAGDRSTLEAVARLLMQSRETVVLLGSSWTQSPAARLNFQSLWNLARLAGARFLPLASDINERAWLELRAHLAKPIIFREEIFERLKGGEFRALYLAGPLPALPDSVVDFLVLQDSYWNENVHWADVVLPATTFVESSGTFINLEGRIQKFKKAIEPCGQARPDWWIIAALAERLGAKNFNFQDASDIAEEISQLKPAFERVSFRFEKKGKSAFLLEKKRDIDFFFDRGPVQPPLARESMGSQAWVREEGRDRYRSLNLLEESRGLRRLREKREK